ncbi:hypothetical protein VNO80_28561 [Phaseolus coccineus]|uniref:Uncharacterized protein n=1 Tax=Phaseolus coccineus TaxID=3886 RepID=A0AAN9QBJ5_PHACN
MNEVENARSENSQLKAKLAEIARDRDDALGKLQRSVEDYARHRKEHQATNRAWETVEAMLQNKISTLDAALEIAKDEISRSFVEGFNGAIEQIKVIQADLKTLAMDPFKSVVDRKIVDKEKRWPRNLILLKLLAHFGYIVNLGGAQSNLPSLLSFAALHPPYWPPPELSSLHVFIRPSLVLVGRIPIIVLSPLGCVPSSLLLSSSFFFLANSSTLIYDVALRLIVAMYSNLIFTNDSPNAPHLKP